LRSSAVYWQGCLGFLLFLAFSVDIVIGLDESDGEIRHSAC
jgi:hypothetical protein